jgi:hypothetical protein
VFITKNAWTVKAPTTATIPRSRERRAVHIAHAVAPITADAAIGRGLG